MYYHVAEGLDIRDLGSSETCTKYHMFGIPNMHVWNSKHARMHDVWNSKHGCLEFQTQYLERVRTRKAFRKLGLLWKKGVLTAIPKRWHPLN